MGTKTIYETKATCKACGNVWHFGKSNTPVAGGTCGQPQSQNTGCGSPPQKKQSSCCGGGTQKPAPTAQEGDRCPKCGSAAVEKEIMKYEVSDTKVVSTQSMGAQQPQPTAQGQAGVSQNTSASNLSSQSSVPHATQVGQTASTPSTPKFTPAPQQSAPMKTSIGSKPIKISGRSVLIGIGAIVLIAISPAFYHVMTILNIAMAAAIFAYLVYPPAREKLSATLKFIPQKASTGKAVALLLLFGFCTLLSIAGWGAALEESKKARAQIEAELASNREIFSQVDSAIAGSEFEKALQLIAKATDNPETIKEKEEKRKLVAEKSLEYFANQGRDFSQKGKWKEAHAAFTKYFGLASAETGMADDLKQAVYKSAVGLSQSGALEEAISLFERIKGVSDSEQQVAQLQEALKEKQYQQAVSLFQQKKYAEAQPLFAKLGTYSDSADYLEKVNKIVEEQKRIAAFNEKMEAAQKSAGDMDQAIKRSDVNAARTAFNAGKVSLEEAEKLMGKNSKITTLRVRLSRGEVKINKIAAEQERQRKIAQQKAEEQRRIAELKGPKPQEGGWDGAVPCVKRALKESMKDPDSFEIIDVSPVVDSGTHWTQRVKYRAKNSFGGFVVEQKLIHFLNTKNDILECPILGAEDY